MAGTMDRINKIGSYFKSKAKKALKKRMKSNPPKSESKKKSKPKFDAFFGKGGVREKARNNE